MKNMVNIVDTMMPPIVGRASAVLKLAPDPPKAWGSRPQMMAMLHMRMGRNFCLHAS